MSNKKPPTARDYRAADAVLAKHPVEDPGERDRTREALARLCASIGLSRFRLRHGLRPPVSPQERIQVEYFTNQITHEEMMRRLKADIVRPIDEEMVDRLYRELEDHLRRLGRFLRTVARAYQAEIRGAADVDLWKQRAHRLGRRLKPKHSLYTQQLERLLEFAEATRLDHGLGLARADGEQANTAVFLTWQVEDYVIEAWRSCRDISRRSRTLPAYEYAMSAVALFMKQHAKSVRPQNLLALVYEERMAVRRSLPGSQPPSETNAPLAIHVERAEITVHEANISKAATASSRQDAPKVVLQVESWGDLAVGVDRDRQYWGFTPAPRDGDRVVKSTAAQLLLSGNRWRQLLDAVARSSDGQSVAAEELMSAWGLVAAPSDRSKDGRCRPGAIDAAWAAELPAKGRPLGKTFVANIRDLAREIRAIVRCPLADSCKPIYLDGVTVRTRFTVRCLVPDESGHLFYHHPPRR